MLTTSDKLILETLRLLLLAWDKQPNVSDKVIKRLSQLIVDLKESDEVTK